MNKYLNELKNGTTEDVAEADISICDYDRDKRCGCMTKSVLSDDGTHFYCGKCGATKC